MSRSPDRTYFIRRAEEELDLGDGSPSPRVAAVHFELAYRYALLCRERSASILRFPLPRPAATRLDGRAPVRELAGVS